MKNMLLSERIDAFISYKRSLGYMYDTPERHLKNFQHHMEKFYPCLNIPDKSSTDSFLALYQGQTGGLYNVIAALREFARFLHKLGYNEAYLIPPKQMPRLHPEPPYFYSKEEIVAFFNKCDEYCSLNRESYSRGIIVSAIFRLLYCCGLRPKEALVLPKKNVHLEEGYLDILQSKGPKSRRIFISEELALYLTSYDRQAESFYPGRIFFFPRDAERSFFDTNLNYYFSVIWGKAFPEWSGKKPRIYDFRHHFAWTNLNAWARDGVDVNVMLPYLMRYMGHNCIKHTLYYFRFVPDFYSDYKALACRLNDRIPEVSDD